MPWLHEGLQITGTWTAADTLSTSNPGGEIDTQYDRNTGMMIGYNFYSTVTHQQWSGQLQSHE
jgi:hypothetical protein